MSTEVREAVGGQPADRVAQPLMECVTPEERLIIRFYRQLGEAEQMFMRRAIEAMASRTSPA